MADSNFVQHLDSGMVDQVIVGGETIQDQTICTDNFVVDETEKKNEREREGEGGVRERKKDREKQR